MKNTPDDLIIVEQARQLLGVSPKKIANLIAEGLLRTFPNPLDKRTKLVSYAEVVRLKPKRLEAA
jgi:predicted DNA-binding transcriptional regulator AlpA